MITAVQASTFLTPAEVAELTGVRIGKDGKSREYLQARALQNMRIPHWVNAAGRPIVARAVIEGGRAEKPAATWSPNLLRA